MLYPQSPREVRPDGGATTRRHFAQQAFALTVVGPFLLASPGSAMQVVAEPRRSSGARLRLSVNAFSFNQPLRAGELTLFDVIDYCAQQGVDALDATGYYFPGYPNVPDDAYLYRLKRHALLNGVTIHGTGVRNDFAVADAEARKRDIQLVKHWVVAASKIGASSLRVFSGKEVPQGYTFDQTLEWMIPCFEECARFGESHGVVIAIQPHHDFLRTAEQTLSIIKAVDSPWLRVVLDIGSLRERNLYAEAAELMDYSVSWQLKEQVSVDGKDVPVDLAKLKRVIEDAGYRGFFPIETLGAGDPKVKIAAFLKQVRGVFGPLVV